MPSLDARAAETVFLELKVGTKLGDVLDMRLFGPFVPGMTCEEAVAAHPGANREGGCSFAMPLAKVDVAYEPSSSGGATFHRRTLYGYPKLEHSRAEAILSSHLAPYTAQAAPGKVLELIVAEHGDQQRVWVLLKGDAVESINWWDPASRRGPNE